MDQKVYHACVSVLHGELIPAFGCTEPIAVAYASAKARQVLGAFPEHMTAECSGNIIKNVQGVIVPTTGDLRGIAAAALLGAVGGDPERKLEVLTTVSPEHVEKVRELIKQGICQEMKLDTPAKLHIIIRMERGEHRSMVELIHSHNNIVRIEKDGEVLLDVPHEVQEVETKNENYDYLSIANIVDFANEVKIDDVKDILEQQILNNTAISEAGLTGAYGARVGATLLKLYGDDDVKIRAKAAAAAGSDARMGGCELPVVINSGSGNQGMTVSLPVIEYAKEMKVDREKLYRALCLSNLTAIYQKTKIGKLSAYCGAVNAAVGAGVGICWLCGGGLKEMEQVIVNTIGNISGIVCDGAKPSCAAKIASSVDAAIMAVGMAMNHRGFHAGEGIIKKDIEDTLESVGQLAREGMRQTDLELLNIMVSK